MALARVFCAAVVTLGLACVTAPACACEGAGCPAAKPLDLTRFMKPMMKPMARPAVRPAAAKAVHVKAAAKQPVRARRTTVIAHHFRKPVTRPAANPTTVAVDAPAPAAPLTAPTPIAATPTPPPAATPVATVMPIEAAAAFAAGPPVVSGRELNEIDRAAGPLPAESSPLSPLGGSVVQFVEADAYNDIDRMADDRLPASFAEPARQPAAAATDAAPIAPANPSLGERLWAMVQHVFAAIASAWRNLLG